PIQRFSVAVSSVPAFHSPPRNFLLTAFFIDTERQLSRRSASTEQMRGTHARSASAVHRLAPSFAAAFGDRRSLIGQLWSPPAGRRHRRSRLARPRGEHERAP